jgi:hypothetical protein
MTRNFLFSIISWFFHGLLLCIFKISESIYTFISGILLSAAISIATSTINNNEICMAYNITLAMLFMFIASVLFMLLAVYLKSIQDIYSGYPADENDKLAWLSAIKTTKHAVVVLPIIFILSLSTMIASIVLIFL